MGSLGDGLVEASKLIDELNLQGILTREDVTLSDGFHLVDGHLTTIGDALAEQLVASVDVGLQIAQLLSVEGTRARAEGSVAVGLHLVELKTELLGHEF